MLPPEITRRVLHEGAVLGLLMKQGAQQRVYYFNVKTLEQPIVLQDFQVGAATAQGSAGTGWSEIQDASANYLLQPQTQNIIYQAYYGITPAQARVYLRYPTNRDVLSLYGTRAVGHSGGGGGYTVGAIDGWSSPFRKPSWQTEFFTLYNTHPALLGYHPYPEPSSITVRLNFYVVRYDVAFLGSEPYGEQRADQKARVQALDTTITQQAVIRAVGGHELVDAPQWLLPVK